MSIKQCLTEENKIKIMTLLLGGDCTYSQLLDTMKNQDTGKLNYHLRQLISNGMIKKKNKKYTLTELGNKLSTYLNQFQLKELYPVPVVCVAVFKENKLLLARRNRNPFKDHWVIPGGKIRVGETIEEACKREVKEEVCIDIKVDGVYGMYPTIMKERGIVSYHNYLVGVKAKYKEGSLLTGEEMNKVKYFSKEEIEKLKLIPSNEKMIYDSFDKKGNFLEQVVDYRTSSA